MSQRIKGKHCPKEHIGKDNTEKENIFKKKETNGNSRIEKNTISEIQYLLGLTADGRLESVNLKIGQEVTDLKDTEKRF